MKQRQCQVVDWWDR